MYSTYLLLYCSTALLLYSSSTGTLLLYSTLLYSKSTYCSCFYYFITYNIFLFRVIHKG